MNELELWDNFRIDAIAYITLLSGRIIIKAPKKSIAYSFIPELISFSHNEF